MTRLVVLGGGLAGLVAAHHACHRLAPRLADGDDLDVVVLEADERPGGKLWTTPFAGRPLDWAADAFLARAPEGTELCTELGLAPDLVSPAARSASVLLDGRLRRLPGGLVLGVPIDRTAVEGTGLLSEPALDRIADERSLAPDRPEVLARDESVGSFLRRRLGDEVVDRMVGPLLGGVNAGTVDELSIEAGAPQLAAARRRGGSFLDALGELAAAADPDAPVFYAHPQGMRRVVDALVASLPPGSLHLGTAVHGVSAGTDSRWSVATSRGVVDADAVVVAAPAHVAARWLTDLVPATADGLNALEWASVAMVALAFRRDDVEHPLDGSGFLVPADPGASGMAATPGSGVLTACSWSSSKWAHLADDPATVVLRASAGRFGDDRAAELADDELVDALVSDLGGVLGLRGAALEARVARWPASLPQYRPGHLDRVDEWEREVGEVDGLAIAGAALRGLGIPAVIASARRAATAALET